MHWLLPAILFALRITTSQYDNARSGTNDHEGILTPRNVNAHEFGKVFSLPVDGNVYAQPLYLANVAVPGKGAHNLLYIATEHDSVYAFDADRKTSEPVWHVSLLPKTGMAAPVPARDVQCPFISPEVGITSTPVIDTKTGTLYVLARTKVWENRSSSSSSYAQELHALAITTGAEKFGGPVKISASVPGNGPDSSGGRIEFNALRENPRAALLLSKGVVYLTWASSCDVGTYHGWVMAYDAETLQQRAVLNTSPDASESGIWMSDTGPAADTAGNVYVVTGNGVFNGRNLGDSALKLSLRGKELLVSDSFTPYNQSELNATDGDLGSGGPLLLPGTPGGLVFGGKAGVLYVVNPTRMGKQQRSASDPAVQSIRLSNGIYSAPAYWNGHLYYYTSEDALKDFAVINGKLSNAPVAQSRQTSAYSGGTPTVSANGERDGIVWVIETKAWNGTEGRAELQAFDAANVSRTLYSSEQNATRDQAGEALRFTIPTVANGHVYVGVKNAVEVYGRF